jgi:acyl-CoA thioester hydrolase
MRTGGSINNFKNILSKKMSILLSSKKIIKEWIDYNDHMNVSYYLLIFDKYGADVLNDNFKMGEHSAKTTGKSTMIVESNITYNQELKLNDEVDINLIFFNHDKKRLQYKMEMIHKKEKYLASTIEILALYVDLNTRKVSEFEDEKIQIMDNYIKQNNSKFNNENLKFSSKLKK